MVAFHITLSLFAATEPLRVACGISAVICPAGCELLEPCANAGSGESAKARRIAIRRNGVLYEARIGVSPGASLRGWGTGEAGVFSTKTLGASTLESSKVNSLPSPQFLLQGPGYLAA